MKKVEKKSIDNALLAICSVEALMYERNQAYAFIAIQGLSNEFLQFIQEKQCAQVSNEKLKEIVLAHNNKTTG